MYVYEIGKTMDMHECMRVCKLVQDQYHFVNKNRKSSWFTDWFLILTDNNDFDREQIV